MNADALSIKRCVFTKVMTIAAIVIRSISKSSRVLNAAPPCEPIATPLILNAPPVYAPPESVADAGVSHRARHSLSANKSIALHVPFTGMIECPAPTVGEQLCVLPDLPHQELPIQPVISAGIKRRMQHARYAGATEKSTIEHGMVCPIVLPVRVVVQRTLVQIAERVFLVMV